METRVDYPGSPPPFPPPHRVEGEVTCGYCKKCVVILCYGTINVFPSVFVRQMGIDIGLINEMTIFVLGQVAALMFGWTFLLIWADRDPVNRRKVLLLTIFCNRWHAFDEWVYYVYKGCTCVKNDWVGCVAGYSVGDICCRLCYCRELGNT